MFGSSRPTPRPSAPPPKNSAPPPPPKNSAPPPPKTPTGIGRSNDRRIEHRGATFDAPRGWQEESIVLIQAPGNKPRPTITFVRATVPPGTGVDLYASRKLAEISTFIPGVQVEDMREMLIDGHRAVVHDLGWEVANEGRYHQRVLYLIHPPTGAAFVLTGSCPADQKSELESNFSEVAASIRLPQG